MSTGTNIPSGDPHHDHITKEVALARFDDSKRGLYEKYVVFRTDGSSGAGEKHDGCDYFVLDLVHDKHAVAALRAYADSCQVEFPQLAADIRIRVGAAALAKYGDHR